MRNWQVGVGLALCAVLAVACGETEKSPGAASAPGTAGTGQQGGSGAGVSPSPVAGMGAVPAPPDCSGFVDDTGGSLTVRIVNETADVIHLGQEKVTCVTDPLFVVRGADGKRLGSPGNCHNCSSIVATGFLGCPTNCPQPLAITLQPGESTEAAWDGLFSTSVDIAKECVKPDPSNIEITQCFLTKRVAVGAYAFSATASKTLGCDATFGPCQDCRPRESGGCETRQGVVGALELTAEAEVSLGAGPTFGLDAPIELVFRD